MILIKDSYNANIQNLNGEIQVFMDRLFPFQNNPIVFLNPTVFPEGQS